MSPNQWIIGLNDGYYGSNKISTGIYTMVSIDSGYQFIGIPGQDYENFMTSIDKSYKVKCIDDLCGFKGYCSDLSHLFSNITVKVGEQFLTITPENYLKQSEFGNAPECMLNVQKTYSRYVLGAPLLLNYYSIYDLDFMRVGLIENCDFEPST